MISGQANFSATYPRFSARWSIAFLVSLSFGAGVELADGDVMDISFTGFGRPSRNPLRVWREEALVVVASSLALSLEAVFIRI